MNIIESHEHVTQCGNCGSRLDDGSCWNCFLADHESPENEGFGVIFCLVLGMVLGLIFFVWIGK